MSGVAPILEQVWVFLLHRFHVATQNLNDLGASCAAVVLRNRAELFGSRSVKLTIFSFFFIGFPSASVVFLLLV